jgi:hypothetical protein
MNKPEIEEFAELLVREVRDRAISSCDSQLQGHANSPVAKRWREHLKDAASKELAIAMIPDCIDDALFYLLHAIDSGALHMSFVASNGTVVDLTNDGMAELAGWYMMSEGWRSQFSLQRFVDDFEDLK